jgi:tetratricopeptide (TPR) repeat protein
MSEEKHYTLAQAQLEFAKRSFNCIWPLLEKTQRTPDEDQEMVLAAFASLYHWKKAGTAVHAQRGSWMISRVYQELGRAVDALGWAQSCLEISKEHPTEMKDFDLAYAQEALARAYALSGEEDKALKHRQKAIELGEKIKDPEDKRIFQDDLRSGNWYNLQVE